jgi:DNA invertase Pin-like site-specific DNA recombinase
MMSKALGIIRLSKSPDPASTSVERQREIIEHYCETRGFALIGFAEDLAVSAFKKPPMDRKQLREWLSEERAGDYDVIVYWRQDRIVRQPWDFVDLVRWATDHHKALESATEGTGDVTQHANMLVGFIGAWQASGESRNTSARVKDSYRKLKSDGRYPGGRVPYGFKAVKRTNGPGYEVVPDIGKTAEIVKEAARRAIAGESTNSIAGDFNRRKIPAPAGGTWWRNVLRQVLQNRMLIGDILSADDYGKLQDALQERRYHKEIKTANRDSLGLDLVFCECGGKIYRQADHGIWKGRCRNNNRKFEVPNPCNAPRVPYVEIEGAIADNVIREHGDWLIEEKVTHATRKLRLVEITRDLLSLPAEFASHRITRDAMLTRQAELLDEQEQIEASEGVTEWRRTGETVRQRWDRLSPADRRLWLLRIGTTYTIHHEYRERDGKTGHRWWFIPSWIDDIDGTHRERVVRP